MAYHLFETCPETTHELEKQSEKLISIMEAYIQNVADGFEDLIHRVNYAETETMSANYELDEVKEGNRAMRNELKFLGHFLSENNVPFPLENHPMDFNPFLLDTDPRKGKVKYDESDLE